MNVYLLSPELSMAILAMLLVLLDLVVKNKAWLAILGVLGLAAPLAFTISLLGRTETSFAGMLAVDDFAVYFKLLFIGIAALIIMASSDYVSHFPRAQGEFYGLVLISVSGMMLLASSLELISIFVALELTTVPLYVLAGFQKDRRSSEAGVKFLILGIISSAVILYGMALLYGLTGTTDLAAIAQALGRTGGPNYEVLLLATILLVAGFGFKIYSVPFQMWVPDVYEGSPTPVTAFLGASKAAGFAVILRLFYGALGDATISADWASLFAGLAAATMFVGNVLAIPQRNIKRMLAYSSIGHAGYIMVGLASLSALGRSGVIFYLASYALTNLGAFFVVQAISKRTGGDNIDDFSGAASRSPGLAAALTLCLLSLIGIPPTSGFIAKVYIFNAGVQEGLSWLVAIAVVNSVISAYYYLRPIKAMFLRPAPAEAGGRPSKALAAAISIPSLAVLALGVVPAPLLRAAETAVRSLLP